MKIKINVLKKWGRIGIALLPVTTVVVLLRMFGPLGLLELAAYDYFFQIRPLEPLDERIIIVGLKESEIDKYYPLEDGTLAQLIEKIKRQEPVAIGLDFYRDVSVGEGKEKLIKVFETTPNLIGVKKVIEEKINPPPILEKRRQIASSDVVIDSDGVLRRGLIVPISDGETKLYTMGAHLALLYLQEKEIYPQTSGRKPKKAIKLKETIFYRFEKDDGAYQNADEGGYQILLNPRNPQQSFQKISFGDVLEGKIDSNLFQDKLVFIGTTASSIKDQFLTSYSRSSFSPPKVTYGVEIQANLASHIISAVLDNRTIMKFFPFLIECSFILLIGGTTTILLWRVRSTKNYLILSLKIIGISLLLSGLLGIASYLMFLEGWWFPIIPCLLEIGGVAVVVTASILAQKNKELQTLYNQLEEAQEQIFIEKKQSALANLVAGVAHEINNPLNFMINFAELNLNWEKNLRNQLEEISADITAQQEKEIDRILQIWAENCQEILKHGQRAAKITKSLLQQAHSETSQPTLTDINDLVESTLNVVTYSKQVEQNQFFLNVETDFDLSIGERKIVSQDLNQILINLIDNACDAVFERKKKQGEEFNPVIFVSTGLLESEEIEIIVADNGEGILPEIKDKIFEPFKTTKPPGVGTGLGLYITYELVQKNRGQIDWKREENLTKFVIKFRVNE